MEKKYCHLHFTDVEGEVQRGYRARWDLDPGREIPEAVYTMPLDIANSLRAQRRSWCFNICSLESKVLWYTQFPQWLLRGTEVSHQGSSWFSKGF